jgi:hypothetical protein
MSKSISRGLGLALISVLASSAMPTAAFSEPQYESGELTVGVVVTEEFFQDCAGDDATLTIAQGELTMTAEQVGVRSGDPSLYMYAMFAFGVDNDIQLEMAIASSLGEIEITDSEEVQRITSEILDESTTEVFYSMDSGIHSLDFNADGVIDSGDYPTYLLVPAQEFGTQEFTVSYDAGDCADNQPYGALSVTRSELERRSNESSDWLSAEIMDYESETTSYFNGLGRAWLSKTNSIQNDDNMLMDQYNLFAFAVDAPWVDTLSFSTGTSESLVAGFEILGTETLGEYRVSYDFQLEVMDAGQWSDPFSGFCYLFSENCSP